MRALVALIAVALVVPAAIPARADADPWPDRYELALARDPQNGFYRYAVLQSRRRAGNQEAPPWASTDRTRWQRQLYEMTTGAWSVQEALQTDRLLGDGDGNAAHTIPIGSIKSVPAATIPFDKLLAGRTPSVEWLARAAPADWYYAHFPRVSAMRRVLAAADKWGSHLLSSYKVTGRDARARERVESQLLLKATPEFDSLYDLVVGEVAVVGSDPFLREGSDVSVVFSVNNALLLSAHLERNRRDAVSAATSHVSILHENYRDWVVDGVATADRTVSSYATIRGRIAIVSNSFTALRRVADAVDGKVASLAASDDFKYMRAVSPYSDTGDDGFLFLSDGFVRRVVGPSLKIGEARRLRCAASLQSIAYGSLMFRTENGRAPASIDELVKAKDVDPVNLRCPDGGRYALEGDIPSCSIHRRLGALTPNVELPVDKVSADEQAAYDTFRENYSNYWRRYIDPVGVTVRARDALEVQANILPLVDNSAYSGMVDAVGTEPVSLARPQLKNAVATLDVKLPKPPAGPERPESESEQFLGMRMDTLFGKALGGTASIQIGDAAPMIASDIGAGFDLEGIGPFSDWLIFAPLVEALTYPTAVVAPIGDRAAMDEVLNQFRARLAVEHRRQDDWFNVDGYQVVQGGARTIEAVSVRLIFLKWRVYYAIAGDRLIIATDPAMIEELAAAEATGDDKGAMRLEIAPARWQKVAPAMALSYEEDARSVCTANLSWLAALRTAYGGEPAVSDAQTFAYFGTAFSCPDGGQYVASGATDVACSIHGTADRPRQGPRPQPGSPAAYMLENVRRVEATLSFTADGISTRIRIE